MGFSKRQSTSKPGEVDVVLTSAIAACTSLALLALSAIDSLGACSSSVLLACSSSAASISARDLVPRNRGTVINDYKYIKRAKDHTG
jgi:hypothetical protein